MACFALAWTQFLATFTASLSQVSDGLHGSWTSPSLPKLLSPDSHIPITQADVNWLELIYLIGGIAGLPLTIYSVDRFGRKRTIIFAAVSNCLTWTLILVARDVRVLYIARFLAGLNSDVAFVSVPMYISELADKKIRGFLVTVICMMMLVGLVICYSLVPFVSITVSSLVGLSLVAAQLCVFPFMPETPYYHLLRNREKEALQSLRFFRKGSSEEIIEKEMEELKLAVARQSEERGKIQDIFLVESNRKGLIIMGVLNTAQHCSSNTVIVMKLHTILGDTKSMMSANSAAILCSIIMLIAAILSALNVDRFGRKILLIFSSTVTAITLASLAGYMTLLRGSQTDISSLTWIPTVSVFVFFAVFRIGLGSVPLVVTGEMFPTSVKSMAMTICDAMYVFSGCIAMYIFQVLDANFGMHVAFYVFALCCVATAFFVYFYMPETKGKSLEQIQLMLKGIDSSPNGECQPKISAQCLEEGSKCSDILLLEK